MVFKKYTSLSQQLEQYSYRFMNKQYVEWEQNSEKAYLIRVDKKVLLFPVRTGGNKGVHTFSKGIYPKLNGIVRMAF